jgi:alpha-beta hydrolase superfamily lysophospholipase
MAAAAYASCGQHAFGVTSLARGCARPALEGKTMTPFLSEDHWAQRDGVKLSVYRKKLATAPADAPVFVLVHGSSFGGKNGFDLQVPGKPDYSFMEAFARRGFDCWTFDFEAYGRSDRTSGFSGFDTAVADTDAAMRVITEVTGQKKVAFYGSSSGAIRAALYAEARPDRVSRLVLDAFVWTGWQAPTLIARRRNLAKWRASNSRPIDRAFFHTIFNRDHPGTSEDGVADALAAAELADGTTVPNGTYLDMCTILPVNDPAKITCPTLVIRGEHDGIATERDLLEFYEKLGTTEKQFSVLPGMAHVSYLGKNRAMFWHAVGAFLTAPERVDTGH